MISGGDYTRVVVESTTRQDGEAPTSQKVSCTDASRGANIVCIRKSYSDYMHNNCYLQWLNGPHCSRHYEWILVNILDYLSGQAPLPLDAGHTYIANWKYLDFRWHIEQP